MTDQTKTTLKHIAWGAGIGAVVAMVVGFSWGGWVTANTSSEKSAAAVLANRSAICVAQFMQAPNHEAQVKEFKDIKSWTRSEFVQKGGWDKMPGEEAATGLVSGACARGIETTLQM